ncbi:MAG: pyruvate dehydrogenase (acetyl-transferring) E1 component subunit alpha [Phycisphaeraceae bacterium]|nr:pyruvate dehydrogenase (acetyl-transferring) E1 component subunit alpha [Phycisphaeraceae bacterium]
MSTATASQGRQRNTGASATLPDNTLLGWLREMVLIREFEIRTMQAYSNAQIGGFCHVYNGQEAVVVGTFAATTKQDPIVTAYRDHGHALARGMDPKACMAEMYGKTTGCAKGKGGSMHMFDRPNNLYGGHGIVGAQTPLGAGLAFATKYENEVLGKGDKRITLCFLGDGALNQGALHEAMNLAGILQLPVIYIVENNGYSMGTAIDRGTTMAHKLEAKAAAYGIESLTIEHGMDVCAIYDAFKPFADARRRDQKPGFVDLHTYRYQGHSMSDPQKYRSKDEVGQYMEQDPIETLKKQLIEDRACLTEEDFKAMQKEVRAVVREAVRFAENSPAPDPRKELYSDVFVDPLPNSSPSGPYLHGETNHLMRGSR